MVSVDFAMSLALKVENGKRHFMCLLPNTKTALQLFYRKEKAKLNVRTRLVDNLPFEKMYSTV
jgi:hypothetical protein